MTSRKLQVPKMYFERDGFRVSTASDGNAAMAAYESQQPDLVLLDLMIPQIEGLEVFRRIRSKNSTPIIMLTAKGEELDRVLGLEMGADDYIVKPFSPREVVARAKNVLRRAAAPREDESAGKPLAYGALQIDPRTREVLAGDRKVELTSKEFDLLYFLAQHPGQVFTRTQLLDRVWGYEFFGDASTVTVHVRRLREKIEANPTEPRYVTTVWGVGYKFERE